MTRLRAAHPQSRPVPAEPEQAASPGPTETGARHVLLVRASDIDVASAARAIAGVTRVTREAGGIWNISADQDVSSEVARRIANKGLLKLLISVKPGEQSALLQCIARHEA